MNKNLSGNVANLILLLAGAALLVSAQGIKTGAAMAQGGDFMPKLLTGIWVVLGVLIFITGIREPAKTADGGDARGFLATLALLLVYFLLIYPIGFVAASVIYAFIQILLFAPKSAKTKKNLLVFAAIAIVIPIAVNLIFVNVFSLILPQGMFF